MRGAAPAGDGRDVTAPEMAGLTERHDWASTPLGAEADWPASLRTTVGLMLASGHAMCLAWGPERTFLYNDAYAPILGTRHPAALGMPFMAVWPEIWGEIAPLVERTFAGETCTFRDLPLVMTRHGHPEDTWWSFSYSPVRDERGEVRGLLNVTSETTARVAAERERDAALAELRASEAFMASVLAASTDCIKVLELDGTLSFLSEGGMRTMEVSDFNAVSGCPWPEMMKDKGAEQASDAIEAARQGRSSHFEAPADTFAGTPKFWSVSVSPILGDDGRVARILSVSRDHTALEAARERQRLLNGELAHRLKNTLAVVQAIAIQTLGPVADRGAVKAFGDRLTALASAHDVLTRQSWSTAGLDEVARAALSTFGDADRITLDGPHVEIGPRATLSLSLMLHELATNAAKHGALSVPGGGVAVRWAVRHGEDGDRLEMSWAERGGPPAAEPTRSGFGSRIIRMGLTGSGGVRVRYGSQGLTLEASAPLDQMRES